MSPTEQKVSLGASAVTETATRLLMVPPAHFGVHYIINPWMEGQLGSTSSLLAEQQWGGLRDVLSEFGEVVLLPEVPGLPDLVFAANAGLVSRRSVVLSSFRHAERRREEPHFEDWFTAEGFQVYKLPRDIFFEGAGDALFDRGEPLLWFGHGIRSAEAAMPLVEEFLNVEAVPLRLNDPRFYHLDTCFCPLERGHLIYFADAFDAASRGEIEARVPREKRLAVSEQDALAFACNAVNLGNAVITNSASEELEGWLNDRGFSVIETPMSEFMRAGGAAKCLSLRLNEA